MDLFLEQVRLNDYTIFDYDSIIFKEKLGRGATGTVYESLIDDRRYAIKHMRSQEVVTKYDYKSYLKDILHELSIVSKMKSKRIMKMYGVACDDEGDVYIVMELIKNKGSLYDYLYESENNFTIKQKMGIYVSIILAVKDLHDNNLCHSDLKPENMCYYVDLKQQKKYIKLIDFNCVTKINKDKIKYINCVYGTYGYCSPEQHKYEIALKSDIYSMGIILLELIYGDYVWDSDYYSYQRYRKSAIEYLEKLKDKDKVIYSIIKKCLCTVPEKRYDIDELYQEIKKYINSDHIHKISHLD